MAMLQPQLDRLAKGMKDYPGLEVLSPEAVRFRVDARRVQGVAICATAGHQTACIRQAIGSAVAIRRAVDDE